MIANANLAGELKALADGASRLAKSVAGAEDLAPSCLAEAYVAVGQLQAKLAKVGAKLSKAAGLGGT